MLRAGARLDVLVFRSSRLDPPGVLRHVVAQGIERRRVFRNDFGRED